MFRRIPPVFAKIYDPRMAHLGETIADAGAPELGWVELLSPESVVYCGISPGQPRACGYPLGRPVVPFSPLFWLGGFPYKNRLQRKKRVPCPFTVIFLGGFP